MRPRSNKKLPYRIGGSWIAAVLGQSEYNTKMDAFFYHAHGIMRERSASEMFQMQMGLRLEPVVAELYREDQAGKGFMIKLKKPKPEKIIVDDWRAMSPDYNVIGKAKPEIMECKTGRYMSRSKWGAAGSDYVPTDYLYQVTWYNGNCRELYGKIGYESCDIAVLFGNEDFRVYPVAFEQELFDLMLEGAESFWKDHVLKEQAPAPDGSKLFDQHLQERFKKFHSGVLAPANDDQVQLAKRCWQLAKYQKIIEADYNAARQALVMQIGENEGFAWRDDDGELNEVTWKPTNETDWKSVCMNACSDQASLNRLILKHCTPSWAKIAKELHPEKNLIELYQSNGERRLKFNLAEN